MYGCCWVTESTSWHNHYTHTVFKMHPGTKRIVGTGFGLKRNGDLGKTDPPPLEVNSLINCFNPGAKSAISYFHPHANSIVWL